MFLVFSAVCSSNRIGRLRFLPGYPATFEWGHIYCFAKIFSVWIPLALETNIEKESDTDSINSNQKFHLSLSSTLVSIT